MSRYISLLKGINVGGHKKILMADLRTYLSNSGLENVETYIQSGNIIFDSLITDKLEIARLIHQVIKEKYSFEVVVLVISPEKVASLPQLNPFLNDPAIDIAKLHVTFLHGTPGPEEKQALSKLNRDTDILEVNEDVIFIYCPFGYGNSKLSNTYIERAAKQESTTRNWKTVLKLIELSSSYD